MTQMQTAKTIIDRAEKDLGPLSDGQRRDLLADNTRWSFGFIADVVSALRASEDAKK